MPEFKNLTGCKVILYDEDSNKKLTETIVKEYEKTTRSIRVDTKAFLSGTIDRVTLLIFYDGGVYEFKGSVKKTGALGFTEIALYKGQEKEGRSTRRFAANTLATVECVLISGRVLPLRAPLEVMVLNISTEGVLIRTKINAFNIGTGFQLKLDISGSETVINTKVVRINNLDKEYSEYGCRFMNISG